MISMILTETIWESFEDVLQLQIFTEWKLIELVILK